MPDPNLRFSRIDDRLIHGQVMTNWLKVYSDVKLVLIVDDQVSQDAFMKQMFSFLVPSGVGIETLSVEDAAKKFEAGLDKPTLLLVKVPKTIQRLMDAGVEINFVNIGGMGMSGDRKPFYRNVSASDEEKTIMRDLINRGVHIEIQITSDAPKVDVDKLV